MKAPQADPAAGDAVVHPIPADRPPPGRRRPATIVCREARTREELAEHFRIRREVFVLEQSVFVGSDRDEHDEDGSAIHLVGYCDGVVAGSVRLYELDRPSGLWKGDRLAVLPPYRVSGLGAPLVRCAVALAGARGGRTMVAHVQPPNVAFFTRLGWSPVGEPETYVGRPHQQMRISLPSPELGASIARSLAVGRSA
ncbi:MAG TPA: MSMEG_0567/Sll0786 family nitrogen starvation N-acetyltransferase [Jiangellaceae bacterium]|nr:MSMEG_0567/Sll0786 family nitrogen starvation N-acetyltransferase [Jiangellaceae bacterium]